MAEGDVWECFELGTGLGGEEGWVWEWWRVVMGDVVDDLRSTSLPAVLRVLFLSRNLHEFCRWIFNEKTYQERIARDIPGSIRRRKDPAQGKFGNSLVSLTSRCQRQNGTSCSLLLLAIRFWLQIGN